MKKTKTTAFKLGMVAALTAAVMAGVGLLTSNPPSLDLEAAPALTTPAPTKDDAAQGRAGVRGDRTPGAAVVPATQEPNPAQKQAARDARYKLPLAFEPNTGQTAEEVKYLTRAPGYTLALTATEAWLLVKGAAKEPADRKRSPIPRDEATDAPAAVPHTLKLTWLGANPDAATTPEAPLPGKVNYFRGNDPTQWRTDISTYERVRYKELYPGIDLVYYGNGRTLEYDLVVAPGADPKTARLRIEGAETRLTDEGHLDLVLSDGRALQLRTPVIYQERDGARQPIEGRYLLARGADTAAEIGFEVGDYDPKLPLVIDPLIYSTFLSDSLYSYGTAIAVNSANEAFVTGYTTGYTSSSDFPTTPGAYDTSHNGGFDAFVTRLNSSGTALIYSTFLGGSNSDGGYSIAVNSANEAFVTGYASSADFPITTGAYDTSYNGGTTYDDDAFVTRLNSSGTALIYSTFLGGGKNDYGTAIAVNSANEAFVTGYTHSADLPTTPGAFDTTYSSLNSYPYYYAEAFVTRLNSTGTGLVYSTYLGGSGGSGGKGIAVNAANEAFVTGSTVGGFPTTVGAVNSAGGFSDVFVARLNGGGTTLIYSAVIGGCNDDYGTAIAVNTAGEAFVTGYTTFYDSSYCSTPFPITPGAFDTSHNGGYREDDAFVIRLNETGTALVYSTFLGGGEYDRGFGIAVNSAGEAFVTGHTRSGVSFPTTQGAFDTAPNGSFDIFVTRLNSTGTALIYSTFLGGIGSDSGRSIAVNATNDVFVTGETYFTSDFPTTAGAFDTSRNGGVNDTFVVRIATDTVDTTPDPFIFIDQANVTLNTQITSAPAQITGINASTNWTASGGTACVGATNAANCGCSDGSFATSGTITNNQYICARHNSSSSYSTATHTVVTVGGVQDIFTSTTLASATDTIPTLLSISITGSNTVSLSLRPGTGSVTSYEGQCTPADGGAVLTGTSSTAPVSVTGLRANISYSCRVRAQNSVGWSGWSNTANVIISQFNSATLSRFEFDTIGAQTPGTLFTIQVRAVNASGSTLTDFNGTVALADASGKKLSKTAITFSSGQFSGQIAVLTPGLARLAANLTRSDGTTVTGASNEFSVAGVRRSYSVEVSNPLPGAVVDLIGSTTTFTDTARDIGGGTFGVLFLNVPEGNYRIKVTLAGYKQMEPDPNTPRTIDIDTTIPARMERESRNHVLLVPGMMGSTLRSKYSDPRGLGDHLVGSAPKLPYFKCAPSVKPCILRDHLEIYDPKVPDKVGPFNTPGHSDNTAMGSSLLIKALEDAGFIVHPTPWDWRHNIQEAWKIYLEPMIDQVKREYPGVNKVDVVAHSTGGLITRAYIQDNLYKDDIGRFIMLATPNNGATNAYFMMEGGDPVTLDAAVNNFTAEYIGQVAAYTATTNELYRTYKGMDAYSLSSDGDIDSGSHLKGLTTADIREFLNRELPSGRDLLPTYTFLAKDTLTTKCFEIPPEPIPNLNIELDKLNTSDQRSRLIPLTQAPGPKQVQTKLFLSNSNKTINRLAYLVKGSTTYPHGKPRFDCIDRALGDGTVLASEGDGPFPNSMVEVGSNGGHQFMVGDLRYDVVRDLLVSRAAPAKSTAQPRAVPPNLTVSLSVEGNYTPLLTAPDSRQTGTRYATGAVVKDIPNSDVSNSRFQNNINLTEPAGGLYQLAIDADTALTGTAVRVSADSTKLNDVTRQSSVRVIKPAGTYTVPVQINSAATPAAQIQDIVAPPTGLGARPEAGNTSLSWTAASGAGVVGYRIYSRTLNDSLFVQRGETTGTTFTSTVPWAASPDETSEFVVVSYNATGVESYIRNDNATLNRAYTSARFSASSGVRNKAGKASSGRYQARSVTGTTVPLTVTFTDLSQSTGTITSWAWDLNGDGVVDSTLQNPTYTYQNYGQYTVTLTVTSEDGTDTLILPAFVTITGDTSPAQFTFTDQTGVARSATITSAPVQITGINTAAEWTATGGTACAGSNTMNCGCADGAFSASGTINDAQYICARHTSSSSYSTATDTVVDVSGVSDTFTSTTLASSPPPPPPPANTYSVGGTVSGLDSGKSMVLRNNGGNDLTVTANGGFLFSTTLANGAGYAVTIATQPTGQTCTVSNGSGAIVSANVASVAVGCSSPTDTTPDPFGFTDQTGVALSTQITSNSIAVAGINTAAAISVSNGEYRINGGAFTNAAGTITNGSSVSVRHTSSASYSTATTTTLTIGGVSGTFTSTTLADSSATYTLTTTKTGDGTGLVLSGDSKILCGPACSASYHSGTGVALTAIPEVGSGFLGWIAGPCSGALTNPCTTTMSAATTATANLATAADSGGPRVTATVNGLTSGTFTSPLTVQYTVRQCSELFVLVNAPAMGINWSYLNPSSSATAAPAGLTGLPPYRTGLPNGTYTLFSGAVPAGNYELYLACDSTPNGSMDISPSLVFDRLAITVR